MHSTELIEKIKRVIDGHRHKYYMHTVTKAEFYKTLVTGVGQEHLIIQYKERETALQKKQRVHLTHTRTKSAANKIKAMFNRVFEVEKLKDKIDYREPDPDKLGMLRDRISQFKGKKSLDKYLNDSSLYYNFVDPNAWLLIGYTAPVSDTGQIMERPYSFPIEIPAAVAVDYAYVQEELQYLITCQKVEAHSETIREYYGYSSGLQVYMVEVNSEVMQTGFYPPEPDMKLKYSDGDWFIYVTDVVTDDVPAMRFGYIPDYETDRNTFAGILDSADQEFMDLINRKSEYDISLALHTFLQKFQIAEPCEHEDGNDMCVHGTLSISKTECPNCHGTGLQIHTTAQQAVLVKRPQSKDEWIPLSEMVKYVDMPFDIVKHQSELVEKLPRQISVTIFGVDITERPVQNTTATAIINYFDSVYAVLGQFADQYSELYMFAVRSTAEAAQLADGLSIQHKFPRDFEMLSLGELLGILDAAKKAGAPDEVIKNIEMDILSKQSNDSPDHLKLFEAKRVFKPFKNIPLVLIAGILNGLEDSNEFKIRYLYNDTIFDNIMEDSPEFVLMGKQDQERLVAEQAEKIRQAIQTADIVTMRDSIINGEDV